VCHSSRGRSKKPPSCNGFQLQSLPDESERKEEVCMGEKKDEKRCNQATGAGIFAIDRTGKDLSRDERATIQIII
jgi:hypothetical protein